jgi:hypothetical protein
MILTALARSRKTQMTVESMSARARITDAVKRELDGHGHDDPEIWKFLPPPRGTFGELTSSREIAQAASDIQRAWHGAKAVEQDPKKDRGEAECIAACKINRSWALFSQDHKAVEEAPKWGLYLYGLPELLMLLAAEGRCQPASAWRIYTEIAGAIPALVCQRWPINDESERLFSACYAVLTG